MARPAALTAAVALLPAAAGMNIFGHSLGLPIDGIVSRDISHHYENAFPRFKEAAYGHPYADPTLVDRCEAVVQRFNWWRHIHPTEPRTDVDRRFETMMEAAQHEGDYRLCLDVLRFAPRELRPSARAKVQVAGVHFPVSIVPNEYGPFTDRDGIAELTASQIARLAAAANGGPEAVKSVDESLASGGPLNDELGFGGRHPPPGFEIDCARFPNDPAFWRYGNATSNTGEAPGSKTVSKDESGAELYEVGPRKWLELRRLPRGGCPNTRGSRTEASSAGFFVLPAMDMHIPAYARMQGACNMTELMHYLQRVRLGDVVIEAGANIGSYTVAIARYLGRSGHMVAFEPFTATFTMLAGNIALNGLANVRPLQRAVGDVDGSLVLGSPSPLFRANYSASSVTGSYETYVGREVVEAVTLDSMWRDGLLGVAPGAAAFPRERALFPEDVLQRKKIALLKVDVEYLEVKLLAGATKLFADKGVRPAIVIAESKLGPLRDEFFARMQAWDYRCVTLDWPAIAAEELVECFELEYLCTEEQRSRVGDACEQPDEFWEYTPGEFETQLEQAGVGKEREETHTQQVGPRRGHL